MKTILVDDEIWSMYDFARECKGDIEFDIVGTFTSPLEALEYAKNNLIEFALLDIEMPVMNGIELAKKLRELYPKLIIIFVTAYEEYLLDFIKMSADYYVMKPYSKEDVESALERAKLLSKRHDKRIFIRTFGHFDVFVDGEAIAFSSKKAKELLALLVDKKGGIVTNAEALYTIWEDDVYSDDRLSLCRKAFDKLSLILQKNGIDELIIKKEKGRMLNTKICDCDYYKFLDGDKKAITEFNDIYMFNYSWGEETLAKLYNIKHKIPNT